MKQKRWMKGLSNDLISMILSLEPDNIDVRHEEPNYTIFEIKKGEEAGIGVAICSVLDSMRRFGGKGFNHKKGKNKAASRALFAFSTKKSSFPINPIMRRTAKMARLQAKLIKEASYRFRYKSIYCLLEDLSTDKYAYTKGRPLQTNEALNASHAKSYLLDQGDN